MLGSYAGCPVWTFTRAGALQVAPPLLEVEMTTSSFVKPLKRLSCQTTYSWPLFGLIAGSGLMSPVRDGAGGAFVSGSRLFGSTTPAVCRAAITLGLLQV